MAYIFLDESGDLGFGEGSSKWFICTSIVVNNHRQVEKVIKGIRKGLAKKYKIKELHAYHANAITRHRMLKKLSEIEGLKVLCVVLDKSKVCSSLHNQKNNIYNFMVDALLGMVYDKELAKVDGIMNIYIDQKDANKFIRERFREYLKLGISKRIDKREIMEINIKPSHTEKCLQAVDFVSWSIFRKYESGDGSYCENIRNNIIEEVFVTIKKENLPL